MFSPPAPLPPSLTPLSPNFFFICMLFLLFHTSLLNCHVLSLCAQTLRPALNLQLMVGISTFLLMSLVCFSVCSPCRMLTLTIAQLTVLKCQPCGWFQWCIDPADRPFEVTEHLSSNSQAGFFVVLFVPRRCLFHIVNRATHSIQTPFL